MKNITIAKLSEPDSIFLEYLNIEIKSIYNPVIIKVKDKMKEVKTKKKKRYKKNPKLQNWTYL